MSSIHRVILGHQSLVKMKPNILVYNFVRSYKISTNKDETCFIIHHPDVEHPYEMTKPLPKMKPVEQSYLKVDSKDMFVKSPNLEQLQAITFTPARYWHQYPGKVKRRKYQDYFNDNVDRRGLTS